MRVFNRALVSIHFCIVAGTVWAQTDTATITGIVSDPSDALVSGAAVEAVNRATGLKYGSITNTAGVYELPALPIGTYDVTFTLERFQRLQQKGIVLHAGDRARIDVQLSLGDVSEVVDVTGRATLLESEISSVGQAVDNRTIVNMPLDGRNYQQLATLSPGVLPSRTRNFVTDAFSVNGANMWQNQFVMDGMDNNNYHTGVTIASNQVIKPSIDAIQEFKIETHNFSAEFGRGGGAVIQVTTKSGTNQFHGTAFEFLRNDKLDANNFFNSGRPKPPYRQNQFGGTLGGPIQRNRTFFFGSYQGTRIREKLTVLTVVPTPEMIRGDFGSTPIYDPATQDASGLRQQFPVNRIPDNRIDPVALQMLQLYPAPNRSGVQNFLFNPSRNDDDEQVDARLDHRFRDRDMMFLRYSFHDRDRLEPGSLPLPASGGNTAIRRARAHAAVLGHTHIFTGNLIGELRVAYSRNNGKIDLPTQERLWEQFGFKGLYEEADLTGLPLFTIAGFNSIGDRTSAPDLKIADVRQIVANLSWITSRHSMKCGTNIRSFIRYTRTPDFSRGTFAFNGQFTARQAGLGTGSALADALLGLTASAGLSTLQNHTLQARASEIYFQDNIKVNRKLTLNLGIRYEYQPPFVERNDRLASFVAHEHLPGFGTIVRAQPGSIEQRSLQKPDRNNFAPRIGLAWQLTPGLVLRSAYGVLYDTSAQTAFYDVPTNTTPFYIAAAIPSATQGATSNIIVRNGFPPETLDPEVFTGRSVFSVWPYDMPDAITHQWNINLQQAILRDGIASIAYVGSNTAHRRLSLIDINQSAPGPGPIAARRRFPTLGAVNTSTPFGTANYQALEMKFEHRLSGGVSALAGYTWSHALASDVGENMRDMVRERSRSPEDLRQRFFNGVVWELPFGRIRKWLQTGFVSALVSGWQVSTIFVAQSGLPFTPAMATNTLNSTLSALNASGGFRPDRIGDGNLPRGKRTPEQWFDKAAFTPPPLYRFGNSGAYILEGPGVINLDSGIARNFRLNERVNLLFRTEFFNMLNEAHFALPNPLIDRPIGGAIAAAASARQIQFGLKLLF